MSGSAISCQVIINMINNSTELAISVAKSPRFDFSKDSHRIEVTVISGRIRLGLASETGRPVEFRGHTPHGQFLLWETGSCSLDVSGQQSQITVREGRAVVIAPKGQLQVEENKRGLVGRDGIPVGPLPPARNLIENGTFREPFEGNWQVRADSADEEQSPGTVDKITNGGTEAIRLFREGTGHAETGIYQLINQTLSDYSSLRLHLGARLDFQSLGVCGALGSECPLMIRIDYQDAAGNPLQWVQGFYYWVDPSVSNPLLCETCPPPRQVHAQHPQGNDFFYESPNLIEMLSQDGVIPASINSISVYASGHSYDVQVSEIELLVEE